MASVFRYEAIEREKAQARSVKRDVAATQEVQADDILEMAASLAPAPAPRTAASVAPIEIDIPIEVDAPPPRPRSSRADSTVQIAWRAPAPPRRKLGFIVAGACAVSVLILAVGFVRRATASDDDSRSSLAALVAPTRPTATSASTTTRPAAPKPATTSPSGDVGSSSPATVGTVIGPAGRVYLDGTRLKGASAIVGCGKHAIRVAPARTTRDIDVPCGGEVKVR